MQVDLEYVVVSVVSLTAHHLLGAFTETGAITYLGHLYATLPVDIRVSRLLFFGMSIDLLHLESFLRRDY